MSIIVDEDKDIAVSENGTGHGTPSQSEKIDERHSSKTSRTAGSGSVKGRTATSSESKASSKSIRTLKEIKENPNRNPFKMPPDNDIFLLRDKEHARKEKDKLLNKKLKVHEKMTYAVLVNAKPKAVMKSPDPEDEKVVCGLKDDKEDQEFTLAVTRDRRLEKETLDEYINKKREMFLLQYSLGVKREEMRKLEEIALAEEKKLELAEQYLEDDAAMFDEFLKENDKNSGDAIKIAEAETKAKLEKVAEIRRLNAQMMSIKSEISKYEDQLKEYEMYRQFLESLSPKEWLEEKKQEQHIRQSLREKQRDSSSTIKVSDISLADEKAASAGVSVDENEEDEESIEVPDLYFTDPQQLLDIFAELEEQNLSLIQNSQETEEALEEMKQMVKNTQLKMEKETDILKEQIEKLNSAISKEEEKAKDLEIKARMFSYGEFKSEDQEQMLADLNKKVEEVYRNCVGDNEASISTLQMLTNIENRLEELFQQIEMMPHDKVEAAEKIKEKERRLKQREAKLEAQRLHQEERVRKALERANAEPKKKTGRRLVQRSEPPQVKQMDEIDADMASREEEELAYYFMP